MKRIFNLIILGSLLLTSCNRQEIRPAQLKVQLEHVSGSRASITVVPENLHAYYTYVLVSENDKNYNHPADEICREEIHRMEISYPDFEQGSFTDVFCYRGSRRLTMRTLSNDMDFKFIVFQINPKTHELIGDPIVSEFHTKPVPSRDMNFAINFEGDVLHITPSDENFTYIWQYEESEIIENIYHLATAYLYMVVEMYMEYGFLEWVYTKGAIEWDLVDNDNLIDNTEYTLAVCGCEEGEFTTRTTVVKFRYHPHNIEVLEVIEGEDYLANLRSGDTQPEMVPPKINQIKHVGVKIPKQNLNGH
jgi:hypothetical protein